MSRIITIGNLYAKKCKTLAFPGILHDVFGEPEANGAWLFWGAEKHGKTVFSLMMADVFSLDKKVLYVSAEEGIGKDFVKACRRSGLDSLNKRLQFLEYVSYDELTKKLLKRNSPEVIFIDNVTVYNDELKYGKLKELLNRFNTKLFIFIAHEERKEPYTSTAKLIAKLAKVIVHVEGLGCRCYGRIPGGVLTIDEHKAKLYHGEYRKIDNGELTSDNVTSDEL